MIREAMKRLLYGFCFAIGITMVIQMIVMLCTGKVPMLPEYLEHFDNEVMAYSVELLLIGCMSGITSAGTVVFESRKIGLVVQSAIFLVSMLGTWIPVACFVWGFHRYTGSMVSTVASIVVTYGICWGIQYRNCRRDIEDINTKLKIR